MVPNNSIGSPKWVTGRGCKCRCPAFAKITVVFLETFSQFIPFIQQPLKFNEVRLQVADEQLRLEGSGYDGRVVRVESYLDVV